MHVADQPGSDSPVPGGALLVNAWIVEDGVQDEFLERIQELFERLRTHEGYLEGAVLRGTNPTRFISYVRMRSVEDRRRLLDDGEAGAVLRGLEQIARADVHSYSVVHQFDPHGPAGDMVASALPATVGPSPAGFDADARWTVKVGVQDLGGGWWEREYEVEAADSHDALERGREAARSANHYAKEIRAYTADPITGSR